MAVEKSRHFYDEIYRQGSHPDPRSRAYEAYLKDPEESPYYMMWNEILRLLTPGKRSYRIADFGCGAGQLAQLLIRERFNFVYGVDFSKEAVRLSKERNPSHSDKFHVGDLYDRETFTRANYNVAILTEVLEHIENDFKILSFFPSGTKIVFSVPNYPSAGHVRVYGSKRIIRKRYEKLLRIDRIARYVLGLNGRGQENVIFICEAARQ